MAGRTPPPRCSCALPDVGTLAGCPPTKARGQPPAAAISCLTISELISVVGTNPCARSKWRRARRVAPSSAPVDLTAYPSLASAIWAARTRCDPPPTGLSRKRAPIWSGAAAGPIEDVISGADAWVARDSPAAGRAAAEAVLNCEIGVEDACEATGGTVAAGAAVWAEAGKGS